MSDDDILNIPEVGESQNSNVQPSSRFRNVLAGGLFALFFGLLIQGLALFGVITMNSGHFFMFGAWVVGALIIITEIFPGKPTKHKVALVIVLGFAFLCIDLISARYAVRREQSEETFKLHPTPTIMPPPNMSPSPTTTTTLATALSPSPSPSARKSRSKHPKVSQRKKAPCDWKGRLLGKC